MGHYLVLMAYVVVSMGHDYTGRTGIGPIYVFHKYMGHSYPLLFGVPVPFSSRHVCGYESRLSLRRSARTRISVIVCRRMEANVDNPTPRVNALSHVGARRSAESCADGADERHIGPQLGHPSTPRMRTHG